MSSQRNAAIDADAERLIGIFKDLHQNPELGFMEVRTASIVARELEALGYEVKTGIGQTGVVGILRNGKGPVVMYRADMDCNAVREGPMPAPRRPNARMRADRMRKCRWDTCAATTRTPRGCSALLR